MDQLKAPIGVLVQHHPQAFKPLDHLCCVGDEAINQLRNVLEVSPTHGIQVVVEGRILAHLFRCLDSPFCHHGVGIAVAELIGDDHLNPMFLGQECRCRTGTTATNDQYIRLIRNSGKIHGVGIDPALGLQEIHDLMVNGVALVGTNSNLPSGFVLIIGMICP